MENNSIIHRSNRFFIYLTISALAVVAFAILSLISSEDLLLTFIAMVLSFVVLLLVIIFVAYKIEIIHEKNEITILVKNLMSKSIYKIDLRDERIDIYYSPQRAEFQTSKMDKNFIIFNNHYRIFEIIMEIIIYHFRDNPEEFNRINLVFEDVSRKKFYPFKENNDSILKNRNKVNLRQILFFVIFQLMFTITTIITIINLLVTITTFIFVTIVLSLANLENFVTFIKLKSTEEYNLDSLTFIKYERRLLFISEVHYILIEK